MARCSTRVTGIAGALFALPLGGIALAQNDWHDDEAPERAPIVCFAEGTPDAVMNEIYEYLERRYGPPLPGEPKYQLGNRWTGGQGTPITLSWSLVPDGLSIPGGVGEPTAPSNLFARMNQLFGNQTQVWIGNIQSCFDRWEELSGIDFQRVTAAGQEWDDGASWGTSGNDTTRGDIRISMHSIGGANGVLAYAAFPNNGDVVLDSSENWAQGTTDVFMRNIIVHELGHSLGIAHVCPANGTKLMEPALSTGFDGPRHDDVRAVQRHYGDPFESDNTSGTANNIGLLSGTPITLGPVPSPAITNGSLLSIDANGESDFFRFTVGSASLLDVTVTPVGQTYNNGTQSQTTGACSAGTSINTQQIANLAFEVIGTNGTTVLTTVSAGALGAAETLVDFLLPAGGDYFVRVFETDSPTGSQLYNLTVNATAACTGSAIADNPGCAGSGGCTPSLAMTGCPAANQAVTLSIGNAVGGQVAILLFGLSETAIPLGGGCFLWLGTQIPISVSLPLGGVGACNGAIALPTVIPGNVTPGTVRLQAACSDPGKPGGFTLTNDVILTIGN
jgi:hypothetical protein